MCHLVLVRPAPPSSRKTPPHTGGAPRLEEEVAERGAGRPAGGRAGAGGGDRRGQRGRGPPPHSPPPARPRPRPAARPSPPAPSGAPPPPWSLVVSWTASRLGLGRRRSLQGVASHRTGASSRGRGAVGCVRERVCLHTRVRGCRSGSWSHRYCQCLFSLSLLRGRRRSEQNRVQNRVQTSSSSSWRGWHPPPLHPTKPCP